MGIVKVSIGDRLEGSIDPILVGTIGAGVEDASGELGSGEVGHVVILSDGREGVKDPLPSGQRLSMWTHPRVSMAMNPMTSSS